MKAKISILLAGFLVALIACGADEQKKFTVPFGSMEPTIQKGSEITADMSAYASASPQRWDIVLLRPPPAAGEGTIWIFRVVGLPGEKIDINSAGTILANGVALEPPARLKELRWLRRPSPESVTTIHPVVLPMDGYYVLGDNTKGSNDSRFWGVLPRQNILGKVVSP